MKIVEEKGDQDLSLVRRAAEGDELAFEELVKKYQKPVLNIIYRYTGDYDQAEDIAQEVFFKVWQKIKTFKGRSKFSTWLYRIVVNQCLDYRRKNKEELISLDKKWEGGKTPEALTVELDSPPEKKVEIVRKAIQELPESQRIALILSKFEARPYQEIAEIMGISLAAVESLIYRAKDKLKNRLRSLRERGEI